MEFLSDNEYKSILGYLPSTIIKNVIDNKVDLSKQLPQHYFTDCVGLFSDISGFTKLSETFSKKGRVGPECLTFCINRYMEQIINIIGANGGDIFKFVGDAIMVIWPPDDSPNFIETACYRALQCAIDIQNKLNNLEIVKGKFLSVKIGIGVGKCHILFVGGLFGRCEYLCVGEAMRQACESETHASQGGEIIMSEYVRKHILKGYNFVKAEVQPGYARSDNLSYYRLAKGKGGHYGKGRKVSTKADVFLMRKYFDRSKIKQKLTTLRTFIPAGVKPYLNIEKESFSKELRLITCMFLNIKIDLSDLKNESAFQLVQELAKTVQRSIYRTRGSLNKFLMDDKGSVMLIVWGIPPFSSRDDPLSCVISCMTIQNELKKLGLKCGMGVATGTCFTGVCGTVGGRREYSLLGDIVNLSSRYMSRGLKYMREKNLESVLVIDETTQRLIQNKIRCKFLFMDKLKGFTTNFRFFEPVDENTIIYPTLLDPFPFIKTHNANSVNWYTNDNSSTKSKSNSTSNRSNYSRYSSNSEDDIKTSEHSFRIFGRESELNALVKKFRYIYVNNTKQIILIRGQYGSGKSLLIRRALRDFINSDDDLYKTFYSNNNNNNNNTTTKKPLSVLCTYQYPLMTFVPFNGLAFIFRQIYLWMNDNIYSKESYQLINSNSNYSFNIVGNSFAKIITQNHCLEYLDFIQEILCCSNDDISLSIHFDKECFNNTILPKYFNKFKDNKRDPFFTKYVIAYTQPIIECLYEFVLSYRNEFNKYHTNNNNIHKPLPLIMLIEDTHLIDDYSVQFISHIMNKSTPSLYPLIVLLTYQEKFKCIKHINDIISTRGDLIIKGMSVNEFEMTTDESHTVCLSLHNISDPNEVENLLKNYSLQIGFLQKADSLFRIDPILINILIEKSFGGIPLFIHDLFDQFIKYKYIQNCIEEILITSDLEEMYLYMDWNDFIIPTRIEKVAGEIIDSIKETEIIILKHASIIGLCFDIQTLHSIFPFQNMELEELYQTLISFEEKGFIEILYDLDPRHKNVVCKFSSPFLKETLYQRMLTEQKTNLHLKIVDILQKSKFSYLPYKIEKHNFTRQLQSGQVSIMKIMNEIDVDDTSSYNSNSTNNILIKNRTINESALKVLLVKQTCDKLRDIDEINTDEMENENLSLKGKEKLSHAIIYGTFDKKSDGKITWESRFFVMTSNEVKYYYQKNEYIEDKVPLATFKLEDIYNIKQLPDNCVGNRKNLFTLSVTKWIKKEMDKQGRTYIFSCSSLEEMLNWVITLNFVRVNAYYYSYTKNYGVVRFPLFSKERKFTKIKKNNFSLKCKDSKGNDHEGRRTSIGRDEIIENRKVLNLFKQILHYTMLVIIGNVQGNICKTKKLHDNLIQEDCNSILSVLQTFVDHSIVKIPTHLPKLLNMLMNIPFNFDSSNIDEKKEDEVKEDNTTNDRTKLQAPKGFYDSVLMKLKNFDIDNECDEEYYLDVTKSAING